MSCGIHACISSLEMLIQLQKDLIHLKKGLNQFFASMFFFFQQSVLHLRDQIRIIES